MHRSLAPGALSNGFDNLPVDVAATYAKHPLGHSTEPGSLWQQSVLKLYRAPMLPIRTRGQVWTALRRTRLDQTWFDRFRVYWAHVLGGRPLWGPEDFHFLRNLYRMRFQSVHLPETDSAAVHLQAWQRPEVLHHLFHSVYKESLFHTLPLLALMRAHHPDPRHLLEFGCGTAPVATTLCEFLLDEGSRIVLSDIETMPFHYAAWKFAEFEKVRAIPLRPAENFQLQVSEKMDVIFCMAVFEHLNAPLATVAEFHRSLNTGGLLIFDYVLTAPGGLDTSQGARERVGVLEYIEKHFEIVHGRLAADRSIGPTVARRRG